MNYSFNNIKMNLGIAVVTVLLTACGGGSSNNDNTPVKDTPKDPQMTYSQLVGTTFSTTPLQSASITAICKDGGGFKEKVITDAQGKWKGDVNSTQLPCRLEVTSSQKQYHGYATKAGNVNLNPLTDLLIANATSQLPSIWYKTGSAIDETRLKTSNTALLKTLKSKGYNIDESKDLIGTVSDLNSDEYQVTKDLISTIEKSITIKDFNELLLLIKDGNIGQIPNKTSISENLPSLQINPNACIKIDEINYNHCNSTVINDFVENQLITPMGEQCTLTKVNDKLVLSNGKIAVTALLNSEENDFAVIPSAKIAGDSLLIAAANNDGVAVSLVYDLKKKIIGGSTAGSKDLNDTNSLVCSSTRKNKY